MRYLIIALLLTCATASAQTVSDKPPSINPSSTQEAIDSDQKIMEAAIKAAGSREAAARLEIASGWKQLKQGDLDVAVQSFTRAYKLDPKNIEVYWGLGNAMTHQGKYAAATAYYERATKIDPQNPKLMADIGLSQTYSAHKSTPDPEKQAQRVKEAAQWFDSAEKLDPNRPEIYANRAIALYLLKNYDEAWKNVAKAESLERTSVDPRFLEDLTAKQARPESKKPAANGEVTVKTEAVSTPPAVQKVEAKEKNEAAPMPSTKLSPAIREVGKAADKVKTTPQVSTEASPKAAPAAAGAPTTAPAKERAPTQAPDKATQASDKPAAPVAKDAKRLEIQQDKALPQIGKDKRNCLDLKTNDEIHRCVYPGKK